ncbi:MAG: DUF5103 domain-containing protein [Bacteroidota bacterium]
MRKSLLSIFFCFSMACVSFAQPEDVEFTNLTYVDYLKTVRLHVDGFPYSYPIISLNGGAALHLSFDDMSDDVRRYIYRVYHCDKDWTRSNLAPLEYIDGFEQDNLNEFDFSFRTISEYIHYDLIFPNRNLELTKSGNYLLVVYDQERGYERPVISRRFYVVDNQASITAAVNRAARIDEIHTHQEVDFSVNIKRIRPRAPLQEITATVIQNNRQDNQVTNIRPSLLRLEELLFDHQGLVSFGGGNEFRNLDIRSVQAPRADVLSITNEGSFYAMALAPDIPRDQEIFLNYFDLNGDFVNFRFDRPIINLADDYLQQNFDRLQLDYTGEYVELTFIFDTGTPYEDQSVYIYGALSEWQLKPEFEMVWNPAIRAYVGKTLVKQGFYNYWYVTQDRNGDESDFNLTDTEGNFDETENDYTVLVYYRPMGSRFDQLVGATTVNSVTE